mmetsp:Transcript_3429/g.12444  ORF Transcript_3429/g.12444 Transcript_3429/m.12444 type:complete len:501 (+) Transcript_3429:1388-2890(+)
MVLQPEQAPRGQPVLDGGGAQVLGGDHVQHPSRAVAQKVHASADVLLRGLHNRDLVGLLLGAGLLVHAGDHAGRADLELETLAPHRLDQDGDVQRPAAAHHELVRGLARLHAQRQVALKLPLQPVLDVPAVDELALTAREGGRVHQKLHPHRGLLHLDLGEGLGARLARHRLPNRDVGHPHEGADVPGLHLVARHALEVGVREDLRGLPGPGFRSRLHHRVLSPLHGARPHPADRDAALVRVEVDGGHEHLGGAVHHDPRRRDLPQDGLKERAEVLAQLLGLHPRHAPHPRAVHHGEVAQVVRGAQVAEELEGVVDDVVRPRGGPVDLVHHHQHPDSQLQGLLEHEPGLGHGTLHGVHQQKHAVAHPQDALHLPSKVGVARGVDDVDLRALVRHRRVLARDGDPPLALQVVGVHHALLDLLVLPEHVALGQHGVHQSRLSVVHVSDNRDVSYLFLVLEHTVHGAHAVRARNSRALGFWLLHHGSAGNHPILPHHHKVALR